MCLISVVPKGIEKNKEKLKGFIKNGMSTNTHGSGYAIKKNGIIYLKKGFRDADQLLESICNHNLSLEDELIIHHRTGTSGKQNDINMHPFIVSGDEEVVKITEANEIDSPVMAHNGVFYSYSDHQSDYNDTFHFVNKFVYIPELLSLLKRDPKCWESVFKSVISSNKLAFLFPDRDLQLIGEFKEEDGYFHSHNGYKSYVIDRGGSSNYLPSMHQSSYKQNTIDFENWDESDWAEYHDSRLGNTHNLDSIVGSKISNKALIHRNREVKNTFKKIGESRTIKSIKFTCQDIEITQKNYNHFIFVINNDKYYTFDKDINKNTGWEIERYDPKAILTPIVKMGSLKIVKSIVIEKLFENSTFCVKSEFKPKYAALERIINETSYRPSQSSLKKISKLIARKANAPIIKYRRYGEFYINDLNNFYIKSKDNLSEKLEANVRNIITSSDEEKYTMNDTHSVYD